MIFYSKKSRLRKNILKIRNKLSPEERISQLAKITEDFFNLPEYQNAKVIGFYASKAEEVSTDSLIKRAFADGKRVILPCIEESRLIWCELNNMRSFDIGEFAVREPKEKSVQLDVNQLDLIVVPGVVFDKNGNRMGYGTGYYDRALANYKGKTVGLAFGCQIVEKVPTKRHDIKIDKVLIGEE